MLHPVGIWLMVRSFAESLDVVPLASVAAEARKPTGIAIASMTATRGRFIGPTIGAIAQPVTPLV